MGDKAPFLIELMGVDSDYKSLGIGRRLVGWACEIADERDAAVYLQTTAAKDYYTKKLQFGFESWNEAGNHNGTATVIQPQRCKR